MIPIIMTRYRHVFKQAKATSIDAAIIPEEHGMRKGKAFNKLVKNGILVACKDGRYYMDAEKEILYKKLRAIFAIFFLVLFIIGLVGAYLKNR